MNPQKTYFLYVLVSEVDERTYIGITENLERRLAEHNSGGTSSIRRSVPFRIHYTESYSSKTEARKRELQLKNSSWHKKQLFDLIFPLQKGSISPKG
jgi:putative endonuclease